MQGFTNTSLESRSFCSNTLPLVIRIQLKWPILTATAVNYDVKSSPFALLMFVYGDARLLPRVPYCRVQVWHGLTTPPGQYQDVGSTTSCPRIRIMYTFWDIVRRMCPCCLVVSNFNTWLALAWPSQMGIPNASPSDSSPRRTWCTCGYIRMVRHYGSENMRVFGEPEWIVAVRVHIWPYLQSLALLVESLPKRGERKKHLEFLWHVCDTNFIS